MDGFKYTHTITLADGASVDHTAEALAYGEAGDGGIVVIAACCGQVGGTLCNECNGLGCGCCGGLGISPVQGVPDTRERHTFYDIGMPLSDGKGGIQPPVDPVEEVRKHVQSVAERHAARHKAKLAILDPLVRRKKVPTTAITDPPPDPGTATAT